LENFIKMGSIIELTPKDIHQMNMWVTRRWWEYDLTVAVLNAPVYYGETNPNDARGTLCARCQQRPACVRNMPCGHVVLCAGCDQDIKRDRLVMSAQVAAPCYDLCSQCKYFVTSKEATMVFQ
jgi:hypothetical protein